MDLSRYAIHGMRPSRMALPATTEDLAAAIQGANDAHEAVVLWGGGTRIAIGEPPSRYDVAVDLTALRGVVEHSPADLVCTVRAGTTIGELDAALAPAGQRWPVDVAYPQLATIGGTIASAEPSPSRIRHQHLRDWVIGCTAVLGDGTVARAGGRVVKNVTGYDLTRLYSGSYGTLAAIAEVSLKLVARDESSVTLTATGDDPTPLRELALRAWAFPVDAIVLLTGAPAGGRAALHVRVAGTAGAAARLRRELVSLAPFSESDADTIARVARDVADAHTSRLATAPGHEADDLSGDLVAYIGTGVAYVGGDASRLRAVRSAAEATAGALVLERATLDIKRELGVWGAPRMPPFIAHALKTRFDPRDVLAPGRMPA